MNWGNIRGEIRKFIKDNSSDPALQRLTNADLLVRANNVQEEMVAFTGMLEEEIEINVTSGTPEYAFTSAILAVRKAMWLDDNSVYVNLRKETETGLSLRNSQWRDEDGTPSGYYVRDNYIGLYPNPDVTRTSGLKVAVLNRPTDLSADADIPFDSEYQFYFSHQGIAFGVARLCYMDNGNWTAVQGFESKYFTVMKEIQKQISRDNIDTRIPNVYEQARSGPRRTR